jgi:DNA-directed RNA polymerase specialized sigma24 family protein
VDIDDEALRRARHDPAAFEPLVDRHSATLHAYLTRRCGPAADDLLSEVWLTAYARRAEFRVVEAGTVRGRLFGIARNHVLAHWRRTPRPPAPDGGPRTPTTGAGTRSTTGWMPPGSGPPCARPCANSRPWSARCSSSPRGSS